jgi:hypothetical protein
MRILQPKEKLKNTDNKDSREVADGMPQNIHQMRRAEI